MEMPAAFPILFPAPCYRAQEHVLSRLCSNEKSKTSYGQRTCWVMKTARRSSTPGMVSQEEEERRRAPLHHTMCKDGSTWSEEKAAFPCTNDERGSPWDAAIPQTREKAGEPTGALFRKGRSFPLVQEVRDDVSFTAEGTKEFHYEEEGKVSHNERVQEDPTVESLLAFPPSSNNDLDYVRSFRFHSIRASDDSFPSACVSCTASQETVEWRPITRDARCMSFPENRPQAEAVWEVTSRPLSPPVDQSFSSSSRRSSSSLYCEARHYLLASTNTATHLLSERSRAKNGWHHVESGSATLVPSPHHIAMQILSQWRAQVLARIGGKGEKAHWRTLNAPPPGHLEVPHPFLSAPFHFHLTFSVMDVLWYSPALGTALLAMGMMKAWGPHQTLLPGASRMTIRTGRDAVLPFQREMEDIWARVIDKWLSDVAWEYVRRMAPPSEPPVLASSPHSDMGHGGVELGSMAVEPAIVQKWKGEEVREYCDSESGHPLYAAWMESFFSFISELSLLRDWCISMLEGSEEHATMIGRQACKGDQGGRGFLQGCIPFDVPAPTFHPSIRGPLPLCHRCVCHVHLTDIPSPLSGGGVRSMLGGSRPGASQRGRLPRSRSFSLEDAGPSFLSSVSVSPDSRFGGDHVRRKWIGIVTRIFFSSRQAAAPLHWAVVRLIASPLLSDALGGGWYGLPWPGVLPSIATGSPAPLSLPEVVLVRFDLWPTSRHAGGASSRQGKEGNASTISERNVRTMPSLLCSALPSSCAAVPGAASLKKQENLDGLLQVGQVVELEEGYWCILSPPPPIPYRLPPSRMQTTRTAVPCFPIHMPASSSSFPSFTPHHSTSFGGSPVSHAVPLPVSLDPLTLQGGGAEGCVFNVCVCRKAGTATSPACELREKAPRKGRNETSWPPRHHKVEEKARNKAHTREEERARSSTFFAPTALDADDSPPRPSALPLSPRDPFRRWHADAVNDVCPLLGDDHTSEGLYSFPTHSPATSPVWPFLEETLHTSSPGAFLPPSSALPGLVSPFTNANAEGAGPPSPTMKGAHVHLPLSSEEWEARRSTETATHHTMEEEEEKGWEAAMAQFTMSCWMGFRLVTAALMEPSFQSEEEGIAYPKVEVKNDGVDSIQAHATQETGWNRANRKRWGSPCGGHPLFTSSKPPTSPASGRASATMSTLRCGSLSLGYFVSMDATVSLWLASLRSCVRGGPTMCRAGAEASDVTQEGDGMSMSHEDLFQEEDRYSFPPSPPPLHTWREETKSRSITGEDERGTRLPPPLSRPPLPSSPLSILLLDEVPQGESWIRKSMQAFTAAMGIPVFTLLTPTQVQRWQEKDYIPSYEVRGKPAPVVPGGRRVGEWTPVGDEASKGPCHGEELVPPFRQGREREKASEAVRREVATLTYMETITAGILSEASPYTLVFSEVELAPPKVLRLLQSVCTACRATSSCFSLFGTPERTPLYPFTHDGDDGGGKAEEEMKEALATSSGHCVRRDGGQVIPYQISMSLLFGLRDGVQLARQPLLFGLASRVDVAVRPAVAEEWRRRYEHLFVYADRTRSGALPSSSPASLCISFSSEEECTHCRDYQAQVTQHYYIWQQIYREAIRILSRGEGVERGGEREGWAVPVMSEGCGELLQQYFLAAKAVFVDAIDTNTMEKLVKLTRTHALLRSALWRAAWAVGEVVQEETKEKTRRYPPRSSGVPMLDFRPHWRRSADTSVTAYIDALVAIGLCDNTLHFLTGKTVMGRCVLSLLEARYEEEGAMPEVLSRMFHEAREDPPEVQKEGEEGEISCAPFEALWRRLVIQSQPPIGGGGGEPWDTRRGYWPARTAFPEKLDIVAAGSPIPHPSSFHRLPTNPQRSPPSDAYILWLVKELLHHFSSLINSAERKERENEGGDDGGGPP